MEHNRAIRNRLRAWYERAHRDLPWRRTRDPYRIWVSEIMLQQTRVAAVIPYYERFLHRFPDVAVLAAATDDELLSVWSGLGYYSRARNLRQAARLIAEQGSFPGDYGAIRELPGVGDYTAAAVASIAFGLPYAAVDGNVLRVLSRLMNDAGDVRSSATRRRLGVEARNLLDPRRPGESNQAIMELGATVCLPNQPLCSACPLARYCKARERGTERELPLTGPRPVTVSIERTVLVIERRGRLLLRQRPADAGKLAGFWELPDAEELPRAEMGAGCGRFRHSITNHNYRIIVRRATVRRAPPGFRWIEWRRLGEIPLSTTARKALKLCC